MAWKVVESEAKAGWEGCGSIHVPCQCRRGEVLACIWRAGMSEEKQQSELLGMFFLDVFLLICNFCFS